MRRFATWTTGHRKTVIFSWIVALIVMVVASGAVGSDFSEEFKLPKSDSTGSLRTARRPLPGAVRRNLADRLQGRPGRRIAGREEGDGSGLRQGGEVPARHRSRQPLQGRRRGGGLRRRQDRLRDDPVRRPEQQARQRKNRRNHRHGAGAGGRAASKSSSAASRSRKPKKKAATASFFIGLLAAVVILLLTFGSVVAMGLPILTALFALGVGISLITIGTHVFDTANFAPVLAAMIGLGVGIDYALFILTRFRNGLDEGLEPREAAIARDRHRRARGPLRRNHRDHLADGDAAARHQLPLRGRGRRRDRGPVHDDRGADPAAGAPHLGRPPGRQAADPRPRRAQDQHRRKQLVVPLEPPRSSSGRCWRRSSPAASC